jgi:phage terminase small subunit
MSHKLSAKDQQFADLYFGGPDDVMGNATACYRYLHPRAKDSTCQVEGSKLLSKPMVAEYLQAKREKLTEVTGINAEYVLRQSIRLYNRAMGDEPIEIDVVAPSGELRTIERREYNPQVAKAALELIGRHTQVQAFRDNVEHSHTHRLEQALARKSKEVEKAALERKLVLVE